MRSTTSWKVSSIKLPNRTEKIHFTYDAIEVQSTKTSSVTREIAAYHVWNGGGSHVTIDKKDNTSGGKSEEDPYKESYISTISYQDETIRFHYEQSGGEEKALLISSISTKVLGKNIKFTRKQVGKLRKSLYTITNIEFWGKGVNKVSEYKIDLFPRNLPYRSNTATDPWGYYIPLQDFKISNAGVCSEHGNGTYHFPDWTVRVLGAYPYLNWKDCDSQKLSCCDSKTKPTEEIVKLGPSGSYHTNHYTETTVGGSIIYPTGGKTEYVFEHHKFRGDGNKHNRYYDNRSNYTVSVGSRIKEIINYDKDGSVLNQRSYRYGVNESGFGVAPVVPCPETYKTTKTAKGTEMFVVLFSFSNSKFRSLLGHRRPVYYPEVTEYFGTKGKNIGKKVYKYNILNKQGEPNFEPLSLIQRKESGRYDYEDTEDLFLDSDESFSYNQLLEEVTYANVGGTYVQKQTITYNYDTRIGEVLLYN